MGLLVEDGLVREEQRGEAVVLKEPVEDELVVGLKEPLLDEKEHRDEGRHDNEYQAGSSLHRYLL